MADFTIDVSRSKTSRINLGIQGENIIEHIIFDISGWIEEFGEGVAFIYAQRKGDENPYPVALDMDLDAGTATWTITDADTAVKGKGKAQLVFVSDDEDSITDVDVYSSSSTYSVGDYCLYGTQLYKCKTTISTAEAWTPAHWDAVNEVKKTRVYATTVQASLVSTSSENPDAYETWLEVLGGYTARIEAVEGELKEWVEDYVESNTIEDVKLNGSGIVEASVADIPLANELSDGAMSAEDKEKLDGIEAGANVNVQADWNQTDDTEDDYIKNKPTIPTEPVNDVQINGTSILNNNVANIPVIHETLSGGYGVVPNPPLGSAGDTFVLATSGSEGWRYATAHKSELASFPAGFALNSAITGALADRVPKPTYKQTFTAPSTGNMWYYRIPYSEDYTFEDLLNFKVYFKREGSTPCASYCTEFEVYKSGDYWRYDIFFRSSASIYYPASGDTIVVENMFTDSDGTLSMAM